VAFRKLVELSHDFFFGFLLPHLPNSYFVVLLPILGGLIVGPLIYKLAPEAKGDGISHIMIALQMKMTLEGWQWWKKTMRRS
jgi:CIC family chloride channel protein